MTTLSRHISQNDISAARIIIASYEHHINRTLSSGERRDLLCDNFVTWGSNYVRAIVDFIAAELKAPAALVDEQDCPGHVASAADPKICRHCGIHIESLRPDEEDRASYE